MDKTLLQKIVLIKQEVDAVKIAPILQRANRAEAVISKAIFIIEELAKKQIDMESNIDSMLQRVERRNNGE